jgi:hypothetical protein
MHFSGQIFSLSNHGECNLRVQDLEQAVINAD